MQGIMVGEETVRRQLRRSIWFRSLIRFFNRRSRSNYANTGINLTQELEGRSKYLGLFLHSD